MNCIYHPDLPAVAYCRACGKALCESCRRTFEGTIYCEEHVPVPAAAQAAPAAAYSPYTAPAPPPIPDAGSSPGLAFLLGLIPGVGAIYNGQYVKGLVHVIILGLLISIVNSGDASGGLEPLFGMMIGVWVFYMAFEAYHTAKKRQAGQHVDEFSSLVSLHGRPSQFPVAPAILIAVGLLFLLNNMDIIRFSQFIRYWPIALIGLGVYMLYERVSASTPRGSGPGVVEQQPMNDASYNLIQAVRGPIMLIALGTLVAIDYNGIYGFGRTWPVLIILFGVLKLLEKATARPVPPNAGGTAGSAI